MKNLHKFGLSTALVALLAACGAQEGGSSSASPAPPRPAGAASASSASAAASLQDTFSRSLEVVHNAPIDKYEQVSAANKDGKLMAIYLAHNPDKVSDQEALELLSPAYYSEPDAFKRQRLAETEMPRIKEKIRHHSNNRFYWIHYGNLSYDREVTSGGYIHKPFDMQSKTFTVDHSNGCWGVLYGFNGISTEFVPQGIERFCTLKVEDTTLAQKIEALRANNQLRIAAKAYFHIAEARFGKLKFDLQRVDYEFGEGTLLNPNYFATLTITK